MTQQRPEYKEGWNYYVPAMQAGGDLGQLLKQKVNLGAVVLTDADGILDGTSIATAVDTTTFNTLYTSAKMGTYGRNVIVLASGAATSAVTVIGRDYLGQPMRETLTLNGTNSVVGLKAFKYIDRILADVTSATTIDLGWGVRMGLPYKTRAVEREYKDNVLVSAGTLTAPVVTDPATATTGDPRGTYTLTSTPDGSAIIEIDAVFDNFVNSSGNGGLHGIKHYSA
jgi:hypothetical protein